METLEREVRAYITDNFLLADTASVPAGGDSLTRNGIIDSVGVVELMQFIENRYAIEILDHETIPENFDTIDNIVRYVGTKLQAAETSAGDRRA